MFRIETISKSQGVPTKVIHSCPATASHHNNGILFNVGRKNTDIVFENDRSVSRLHCALSLITSEEQRLKNGSGFESYGIPKEGEEIMACDCALDGVAVVLEDLGR
jgi:hypothetical protein